MSVENLKQWFVQNKRDLPWREEPTPYQVWVSEIMLQQTQVSVVIPYFLRWMEKFPTIETLAAADINDVIKEWEGLGYYSRARNLHQGAKEVVEKYEGALPSNAEALKQIKGIGDYTVGAILSFAFKKKAPAIDGNVIRVITRLFGIEDDVTKRATQIKIREAVMELLPEKEPWLVSEALIELGATLCTKKPSCKHCPLRQQCRGFLQGNAEALPYKSRKIKIQKLYRSVAVVTSEGKLLLRRGEEGELMHDLHEFPYFDVSAKGLPPKKLGKLLSESFSLNATFSKELPPQKQSFTRYQVELFPVHYHAEETPHIEGYLWYSFAEVNRLAFSSGHRRILQTIEIK